jgi:hypothetical protein
MEYLYLTFITNIVNEKRFDYFTFDKKDKQPLKLEMKNKNIIGNLVALNISQKNMLITTYHFGGLNDVCDILKENSSKLQKLIDIPILDISIFTCKDDTIKYYSITNSMIPKENDNVEIINVIYEPDKIKKQKYSTKIIKIEQQQVINNIFPSIPTIVVENTIGTDLHGFSGSILLKDGIIIGIISSVTNIGINCIPIYCIEKMLNFNTIDYACLPIKTQLYELEDNDETFYGLNIEENFRTRTNLLPDDCIIEVDRKKIDKNGCIDFFCFDMYIILNYKIGEKVSLKIVRENEIIEINEETLNFILNCSVVPIISNIQCNLFGLIISEFDVSYENKKIGGELKKMLNTKYGKNHYIVIGLENSINKDKYNEIGFPLFELNNSIYYPILRYINGNEVNCINDLKCDDKTIIELIFEVTPYQIIKITYIDEKIVSID